MAGVNDLDTRLKQTEHPSQMAGAEKAVFSHFFM